MLNTVPGHNKMWLSISCYASFLDYLWFFLPSHSLRLDELPTEGKRSRLFCMFWCANLCSCSFSPLSQFPQWTIKMEDTSFEPYKTCKLVSTEIINHSIVYENVNLKEISNLPKGVQETYGRFGDIIQILWLKNQVPIVIMCCYCIEKLTSPLLFFQKKTAMYIWWGKSTYTILVLFVCFHSQ